ncbi:sigma-54 interaction domain-containing protein [Clostridium novyi]
MGTFGINKTLNKEESAREVLDTILDISYDGIVVVDTNGYITMLSKAYAEFLEVDRDKIIGKHVTDVIENTRMHIVAKTGVAESSEIQKIRGGYTIATRIPIFKNNEVQGAIGKVLFRDTKDFNLLYKKISSFEENPKKHNKNNKNNKLKKKNSAIYSFENIIGESPKIQKAKELAKKAALTKSNVLLIGESGTGKELFAHAIHKSSNRAYENFVKVNCAAIPGELLESELFGYEKGAFTGAKKEGKMGKIEIADGGTIFLDEIGDMPLHMQAKLLRFLQEKELEKIGAESCKKIDVRVIAATNKNLSKMVKEGSFREDLYYRLNVVTVNIPALRDRIEDIVPLTTFLLDKICTKLDKEVQGISSKAMKKLMSYSWLGNVRQLENVIERAVNIVEYDEKISLKHLPYDIVGRVTEFSVEKLEDVIKKTEKETILNAITAFNGNKTKAAKALNISRTTLYEKMTKHHILF